MNQKTLKFIINQTLKPKTMRKSILLLITFFSLVGYVNAQWNWQNPLPTGNELRSVNFPNATTGYAVGAYGTILKTTNAGASWQIIRDNDAGILYSVSFTDALNGVAVGSKILKTTDGGTTWTEIPNISNQILRSVKFVNATVGYAAGNSGTILKTTDAGQNWVAQTANTTTALFSVSFVNEDIGYIVGSDAEGKLFKTVNGGADWIEITTAPYGWGGFTAGCFTDVNTGYIGEYGIIAKTIDGGATWDLQGIDEMLPREIVFFNHDNGYMVGDGGVIYHTTDAGTTWSMNNLGLPCSLYSISVVNSSTAYSVGCQGNIYMTADAGITWTGYRTGIVKNLNSVVFTNTTTGYAVGLGSTILKTEDSGDNWTSLESPVTNGTYNQVFFTDDNNGYIIGNSGVLLKTTNAGTNWTKITTGTTQILNGIHFPTSQVGYIAVQNGKVLKTTDGGSNWTTLSPPSTVLYSVYFTSQDTGFICGKVASTIAAIFKTTDGGSTWETILENGSVSYFRNIVFPEQDTGYCMASLGKIFKTTDAGATWNEIYQVGGVAKMMFFTNADKGYSVVGNSLHKTTDGGTTWIVETIQQNLLGAPSCFFTNTGEGWAVSNLGTIIHKGIPEPSSKTLNLTSIFLEALYDGSNRMREANGEAGPQFGEGIADEITVELHNASAYGTIDHTFNNVQVDIYGNTTITIPSELTGDYYITIKHRNSIETVSALPVSFAGSTITYAFDAPGKAYGNNLQQMTDGTWTIFGGDVNQDGSVDTGDMVPVDNDSSNYATGYLVSDVNGDGGTDTGDMIVIDNNSSNYVGAVTP
jgi:photosystem II stability/assembly factor-like uncharacterized protein